MQMNRSLVAFLAAASLSGCGRYREDLVYDHPVEYSWQEPELGGEFALFQGVTWDPAVSRSLRPLLGDHSLVGNRTVLDLFSGPGVIAVACGHEDAKRVLSLAENESAAACARYNVAAHALDSIITVRLLERQAALPLPAVERFEVILATLTGDASEPAAGDVQILIQCITGNLELGGRAFAVCLNDEVVASLTVACEASNLTLLPARTSDPLLPVFEIQRPATTILPSAH